MVGTNRKPLRRNNEFLVNTHYFCAGMGSILGLVFWLTLLVLSPPFKSSSPALIKYRI